MMKVNQVVQEVNQVFNLLHKVVQEANQANKYQLVMMYLKGVFVFLM